MSKKSPILKSDPRNARKHPEKNRELIRNSLKEIGPFRSIAVDGDGIVRAGNGVFEEAKEMGLKVRVVDAAPDELIAVKRADIKGKKAERAALLDNRASETSEWDEDVLAEMVKDDGLLDGIFSEEDLISILGQDAQSAQGMTDPDDIPEPPDKAITQPGDLWIMGNHRLLCADSSKPEDVDRLLDGGSIHLVNTDPPYNVKVEPRSNNAIAAGLSSFPQHAGLDTGRDLCRHPEKANPTTKKLRAKDRPLTNDFVSDAEFDRLLRAWFGNIARVLQPGRAFYIWGGYSNIGNYPPVLKAMGLYFSQTVIWVKEHPVLTRKDFMGNHEWAFYGWREGAAHKFFGPNNATDVWSVKKVNPQSMVHLTEKPVELAARAMQYSSRAGENVLDLFGGSGSTLMGAEQTGRRAYLMELDQLYCDVIVARWEKFTGQKAELASKVAA
jgi:DNA modification methylase